MSETETRSGQVLIDGFTLTDRSVNLRGDVDVKADVYDTLQLGSRLRIVLEGSVVSRLDRWERDEKWGDDEAFRRLGVKITATRSAKVITDEEPPA